MDKESILRRRELAFEAEYFSRKDAELVDKLKAVFRKKIDKQSIRETTGVTNEELLDRLVELNLTGELMAAFKLLPIIEVAWADGRPEEKVIDAVLVAAEKHNIPPGSAAYTLLEERLRQGPSKDARKIWYHYAEELRKTLNARELTEFRSDLLEVCRRVAEASGGVLNLFFKVSANEKRVMEAVERALTA